jgi:hypothetical protein
MMYRKKKRMVQDDAPISLEQSSMEDMGYQMGKLTGRRYPYLTIDEQNRQARDDMRSESLPYSTKQWQYIEGWLKGYGEVSTQERTPVTGPVGQVN